MRSQSRNASSDHFDLLPFVAILMCTLGCLLFITLSEARLSLTPSRPGNGKEPVVIEWGDHMSVIHDNGRRLNVSWDAAMWKDMETGAVLPGQDAVPAAIQSLLDQLSSQSSRRYAFFAVRPMGFSTFLTMRKLCQQRHIDVGYVPVGEKEEVKLERLSIGENK